MNILKQVKQAFTVFVETCKVLTEALQEHTRALRELQITITAVEQHAKYLAHSERQRNQREGRNHV